MKTLRVTILLVLSLVTLSCSGDDDGGSNAGTPEFTATINGGTFNNYTAALEGFSVTASVGLTIAITDTNFNIIRLFMNNTGGFSSGVVKEVGNIDSDGFVTTVTIRDQEALITYTATSGSISISEVRSNPDEPSLKSISGTFNITASDNNGATVTMTGSFSNLDYLD